ncbi:unnamed protein product [Gongylonema pulchrum]|uniref:C2H2-type domain-containing protein n=1 Tax=Gongylonema pulchrum TaxID=637853 RepID=A0A183DXJ1_9BILA|nr:unnamed protein product [Gongylonema pulchrum]
MYDYRYTTAVYNSIVSQMSLAAACKLFICFFPLHLAAPSNHSFLSSDALHQKPAAETIPAAFTEMTSYLYPPDTPSRNLATDVSHAGFAENIGIDVLNFEITPYYHQMDRLFDDWLQTIDNPDQSLVSNENLANEQGIMDFEATLLAAEPDAAQAAATTSDVHAGQTKLWNSRLDSDTISAFISKNAQFSELQPAADLEQTKHIQQKPVTFCGKTAMLNNPLLTYATAQLPSDPMDIFRTNRGSRDLASISSTEFNSKSLSTLLQSPTTDKLGTDATCLHGSASDSGACSMPRSVDSELPTDPCTSHCATGGATVSELFIVRSSAACNPDTSDKYFVNRLPEGKSKLRALLCSNPLPPVVNDVPIGKPSMTAPVHFITKQSTSSKKLGKKLSISQSAPTQNSVRTGLTTVASVGLICTAQPSTSNSTKSTKWFTCGRCGKLFLAYVVFKKHLNSHNKKGEYRCNWPECGILETGYRRLSRHYVEHLSGSDLYPCDTCGKVYDRWCALTMHKQAVHTKGGEFCSRN